MFFFPCNENLLTGVVTSPNFPDNYPNNLEKIQTIQVKSGKILKLEFTHFEVEACNVETWDGTGYVEGTGDTTCPCDFVTITDGDGTILMDKSCGSGNPSRSDYFQPPAITSRSNRVEIFFHTYGNGHTFGWSLGWAAVTPGNGCFLIASLYD